MKPSDSSARPTSLRGFWSLFVTQFQVAFSDNTLKWLVIFLITAMNLPEIQRDRLVGIVGALFALPFILFSMTGGFLADRFSKRTVTIGVKIFEIGVMSLVLLSLATHHLYLTISCVFLMEVHSSIFGPSKYGLLPELLPERKLSWGNGVLELGTFLAIIGGTVAGGWLCETFAGRPAWSGVVLIGLALFGLTVSLGITRVPAADPAKKYRPNFLVDLWAQIQRIRRDRVLWLAFLGNTYFFTIGALVQLVIVIYASDVLHVSDPTKSGYLQAATAVGIGLGSFAAGYLSGGKIEYGLIPLGAVGLTAFAALLGRTGLSFGHVALDLGLLGFFGGFYIVPISALLQHRPAREEKGGVLAAANLLSFVGISLASGFYYLFTVTLRLPPHTIFLIVSAATFLSTIYILVLLPDSLLRFGLWLLTRTVYRIRVRGRDHIPEKGGALFVCNHSSFVDALLVLASTDRRVRFMMFKAHYELPFIKPFARILGVIPISSEQRPREMIQSLQTAGDAIRGGDVVCIFAEGQITRLGHLLPFRRGFERIMRDVEAPIIPVALDGIWGSLFSFERRRFIWKLPRRLPHPITVNFGPALPHTATPFEVRQAVQDLQAEAWRNHKAGLQPLHRAFVRTARRHPLRFAMADAQNAKVNFISALARTVLLARRLRRIWSGDRMVGVLLPPSVAGALVNFAALLSGKVPVNLNYTVSEQTLASCLRQCEIQTVITSKAFLEKLKLNLEANEVCLEELVGRTQIATASGAAATPDEPRRQRAARSFRAPSAGEKWLAFLMALFLPVTTLERRLRHAGDGSHADRGGKRKRARLDDLATVIFSSGSTGEPKGVMLSHYNIGSNVEQLDQVFGLGRRDRILGILPFFHSFGFTGTLCLPAMLGVGVVYHANPLDGKAIGPLVRQHRLSFLLATPTFLQFYVRTCSADDFGSLRLVMTGAEKLPDRLVVAFEEQFGIRPLEGYGCTECGPAVAVNTHDFRSAGFRQIGAKRGKIGHPLPGMSVRIVDPETRVPLPVGQPGLLLVRGPNVMQGYLGQPERTAEVLIRPERWYVTGDIAAIDEDGFLQITDRLSRFSKIGGEMVPHLKIEEHLHELAGASEQSFAVTGVPDEKKGDRLVVLHTLADGPLRSCLEKLANSDMPNLWKPRADQFFHLDALPYLGSGKLDLKRIRELANHLLAPTEP